MKANYKVLVLPGDGIGPEVCHEATRVLSHINKSHDLGISINECSVGGRAYEDFGTPLPDQTLSEAKLSDAILLGAVGGPTWDNLSYELRPERALINPTAKMDNLHKGKIEEVIYHGDHTRVRINLLGNPEFILKVPNSSSNLDIKLGNEINIGWNSDDARALDPK